MLLKNIDLISHFLSGYEKYHIKYLSTLETELDSLYCKLIQDIDIDNTSKNDTISVYSTINYSKKIFDLKKMISQNIVYLKKSLFQENNLNSKIKYVRVYYKIVIKLNIVLMCIYMMYNKII